MNPGSRLTFVRLTKRSQIRAFVLSNSTICLPNCGVVLINSRESMRVTSSNMYDMMVDESRSP